MGQHFLIAGYTARDLLFRPFVQEYFNTSPTAACNINSAIA
jgi:hypothetical protein